MTFLDPLTGNERKYSFYAILMIWKTFAEINQVARKIFVKVLRKFFRSIEIKCLNYFK